MYFFKAEEEEMDLSNVGYADYDIRPVIAQVQQFRHFNHGIIYLLLAAHRRYLSAIAVEYFPCGDWKSGLQLLKPKQNRMLL